MEDLLRNSIQYSRELTSWGKIEGERLVLACQWKVKYQNANKFGKWFMRVTTPKSLFEETPFNFPLSNRD
jgi:hypothetical protein